MAVKNYKTTILILPLVLVTSACGAAGGMAQSEAATRQEQRVEGSKSPWAKLGSLFQKSDPLPTGDDVFTKSVSNLFESDSFTVDIESSFDGVEKDPRFDFQSASVDFVTKSKSARIKAVTTGGEVMQVRVFPDSFYMRAPASVWNHFQGSNGKEGGVGQFLANTWIKIPMEELSGSDLGLGDLEEVKDGLLSGGGSSSDKELDTTISEVTYQGKPALKVAYSADGLSGQLITETKSPYRALEFKVKGNMDGKNVSALFRFRNHNAAQPVVRPSKQETLDPADF